MRVGEGGVETVHACSEEELCGRVECEPRDEILDGGNDQYDRMPREREVTGGIPGSRMQCWTGRAP